MNLRVLFRALHSADLVIIAYGILLSSSEYAVRSADSELVDPGAHQHRGERCDMPLAVARSRSDSKILEYIHDWYAAPLVFLTFKELYFIIAPLHGGRSYDDLLIAADRWLFGVNPTQWLMHIANPVLTEVLQIAYTIFYLLFLAAGLELYRRKDRAVFHFYMFTCVYGFYLSYLGYFTLPAVGPRFTLHDFGDARLRSAGALVDAVPPLVRERRRIGARRGLECRCASGGPARCLPQRSYNDDARVDDPQRTVPFEHEILHDCERHVAHRCNGVSTLSLRCRSVRGCRLLPDLHIHRSAPLPLHPASFPHDRQPVRRNRVHYVIFTPGHSHLPVLTFRYSSN